MKLVDLFCGGGGFSRGAHQAGLDVAAAFDIDPILTASYKANFPKTKLFLSDVAELNSDQVSACAGGNVDGIFGGPPCQGFSNIGHRDPTDVRRKLVYHFFRVVAAVEPTFFIMENVPGLSNSGSGSELDDALALIVDRYDVLGPVTLNAGKYGAATKRNRIFVIGTHKGRADPLRLDDIVAQERPPVTVRQAIADLENATFHQDDEEGFDWWKTKSIGSPSVYARGLRAGDGLFTGHRPTVHTSSVIDRFAAVSEGGHDSVGRHPRLAWDGQCPTLRAGTGSDKGSYQSVRPIHPRQNRVITVREAARLQGFPDVHRFHPTIWHSFRMIGNSVSPMIAEAIFQAISCKLEVFKPRETELVLAAE